MTLTSNPILRIVTLCALYLAQGVPWGFVAITLVAWMAEQGMSTSQVAHVTMLSTLPWTFKWAWGPVIDRYGFASMGRRRPWILLAQALMALTILAMVAIPDVSQGIGVMAWLIFIHNLFNSLQDVSVDALAVDLLSEEERGKANGLMYGSKYLGGAIGGAGMATVIEHSGMRSALLFQVLILGCIFLLPLLLRERPGERLWPWSSGESGSPPEAQASASIRELFGDLWKAFTIPSSILGAALGLTLYLGSSALSVVVVVFIVQELGWGDSAYAQVVGGPGLVLGLVGSVAGGFLADRFGHKRIIALGALGLSATWVAFVLLQAWWTWKPLVVGLVLLEAFLGSMTTVGMFALAMGISWPKVAATQFTAYMAILNLSSTIGYGLGGKLESLLSISQIYLVCAALQASVLVFLVRLDPGEARRRLGGSATARESEALPGAES